MEPSIIGGIINKILEGIGSIIGAIISLLPDSPFIWLTMTDNDLIKFANWIIPFDIMITNITAYLVAVLSYYLIRVAMRWAKIAST